MINSVEIFNICKVPGPDVRFIALPRVLPDVVLDPTRGL